jgi:uncharacterized membrane protein YbhN (UPF0104 family)
MRYLARAWPALIGAAALAWVFFAFDWALAIAALARIDPWSLLPWLALICLGIYAASTARWIALNGLPWRWRVLRDVQSYVAISIAIGLATPMQVGEALKVKYARDSGVSLGASATKLVLERLLDLACVAALVGAGLLQRLGVPPALALLLLALPLLVLTLSVLVPLRLRDGSRIAGWIGPPLPIGAVCVTAIATAAKWALTLWLWLSLLAAIGITPGIWQGMMLVGLVALAGIVSMVPAGLGVQEVSAAVLLAAMGYPAGQAEAGALALRLLLPVMLVVGLAHWPLLRRRVRLI